jgi:hypothetical protein
MGMMALPPERLHGVLQDPMLTQIPPPVAPIAPAVPHSPSITHRIYAFGLSRDKVEKVIQGLHVPAVVVRDLDEATMVMTLKNYYRQGSARLRGAEQRNLPIYVLRASTAIQIERQLLDIFGIEVPARGHDRVGSGTPEVQGAIMEAETAIHQVLKGEKSVVELTPQGSIIRRLQHQMAERYNVTSESRGKEPHRRVKVSR